MSLNLDTDKLFFYNPSKQSAVVIPLYPSVVAGFPSPADDYLEEKFRPQSL